MINLASIPRDVINRLDQLGLEPLKAHRFAVQIDGEATKGALVGFDRVLNLGESVTIREVAEGGYRGTHKFPRRVQQNAITLVRGMTFSRFLWDWFQEVRNWGHSRNQPDYRRNLSIYALDQLNLVGVQLPYEVWRWDVFKAWPREWRGPDLSALANELAFEQITIEHAGIEAAKGIFSGRAGDVLSLFQ